MFRKIKITALGFMTLMLFMSIFTVSMPSSSAGIIDRLDKAFACESRIEITFDEEAANYSILPLDMVKTIPVTLNYKVVGLYVEDITPDFSDTKIFVELEVENTPEWCNATLSNSLLSVYPTPDWNSNNVELNVKIYTNAHASYRGEIKIKAKVQGFGPIKGGSFTENIDFTAGYLPILKVKTPKNHALVTPGKAAYFPIEIENLGNGETNIETNVLSVPDGWTVSVNSDILIGTRVKDGETKKTISLAVMPPDSFGYHNEQKVIKISFTPSYFENSSCNGSEHIVSFIVKSKGFSTPGFESGLLFMVLAFMVVSLIARKRYKTIKKMGDKEDKRGENV